MNWKTITAHLDVDSAPDPRLEFAIDFASNFGAATSLVSAAEPAQILESGLAIETAAQIMHTEVAAIEAKQRAIYDQLRSKAAEGLHVEWSTSMLDPTSFLLDHLCGSDLAVVFASDFGQRADFRRTIDIGRLLVCSGRPVLLAAHSMEPFKGTRVVVAWKNCREARRAVSDALPALAKAEDVVVLSVREQGSDRDWSVGDVVQNLTRHGVAARSLYEDRPSLSVAAAITSVARGLEADLIVAGAYSHNRLREWMFGGVTRSLLEDNSLNRLLSN
ncbi:universal stress protein (plasmid) [Rhizobium sp. F40D2]